MNNIKGISRLYLHYSHIPCFDSCYSEEADLGWGGAFSFYRAFYWLKNRVVHKLLFKYVFLLTVECICKYYNNLLIGLAQRFK